MIINFSVSCHVVADVWISMGEDSKLIIHVIALQLTQSV